MKCPECGSEGKKTINWVQGFNGTWYHECWECGSAFCTPKKLPVGELPCALPEDCELDLFSDPPKIPQWIKDYVSEGEAIMDKQRQEFADYFLAGVDLEKFKR